MSDSPAPAEFPAVRYTLRITPHRGETFTRRFDGVSLVLGRASDADVTIPDPFLSRHHARLHLEDGDLVVEDLDSSNGTFVDGDEIEKPTVVGPGTVLTLSQSVVAIERDTVRDRGDDSSSVTRSAIDLMEQNLRDEEAWNGEAAPKHAERLALLNRVHRALASPTSLEELLELILDQIFQHLQPEEAAIFLRDDGGRYRQIASRTIPELDDEPFFSETLIDEVAGRGLAVAVTDTGEDDRFSVSESIQIAGVRSILAAPLLDGEESLGLIALGCRGHVHRFTEADLELLVSLASVAALRLRNVSLVEERVRHRELERDIELAREIQLGLFPEELPKLSGYDLFGGNLPSRLVSGDFYNATQRAEDGNCVLMITDVSGKGVGAAMLGVAIEALAAGPIEVARPPEVVCDKVSRRLCGRTPTAKYATAIVAELDPETGHLQYANAGHPPGLLLRGDGQVERLDATGCPLGLFPEASYQRATVSLMPEDLVVLYTDGVSEAIGDDGEEFGIERLIDVCLGHRDRNLRSIAFAIERALREHVGDRSRLTDDRTVLILRRTA